MSSDAYDKLYWETQVTIDGYEHDLDVWEAAWYEREGSWKEYMHAVLDTVAEQHHGELASVRADLAAAELEIDSLLATIEDLEGQFVNEYRARRLAEQRAEDWRDLANELERLLGP